MLQSLLFLGRRLELINNRISNSAMNGMSIYKILVDYTMQARVHARRTLSTAFAFHFEYWLSLRTTEDMFAPNRLCDDALPKRWPICMLTWCVNSMDQIPFRIFPKLDFTRDHWVSDSLHRQPIESA